MQWAVEDAMKPGVAWPDMHALAYRVGLEHLRAIGVLKASAGAVCVYVFVCVCVCLCLCVCVCVCTAVTDKRAIAGVNCGAGGGQHGRRFYGALLPCGLGATRHRVIVA